MTALRCAIQCHANMSLMQTSKILIQHKCIYSMSPPFYKPKTTRGSFNPVYEDAPLCFRRRNFLRKKRKAFHPRSPFACMGILAGDTVVRCSYVSEIKGVRSFFFCGYWNRSGLLLIFDADMQGFRTGTNF